MSAVNGQVSRMDRAAHLRKNQVSLDQLWSKAKIVHFSNGRLAVSAETNQLRYLDDAQIG
jgi:NAD+ diphosphatase